MKIYLIGYMASGKTRLGKYIAGLTGHDFLDLDGEFEEHYRLSVLDFFEKYGEQAFRPIERELLLKTRMLKNTVIATGGGTPCFFDNMDFIKKNGLSIYIRMSIPELVQRLKKIKKKRPLLKDVPPARLESYIREQIAVREPYYTRADHILDGPVITPQQLAGIAELAGLISPS